MEQRKVSKWQINSTVLVATWNVCGLKQPIKSKKLSHLSKKRKKPIFSLQETHEIKA